MTNPPNDHDTALASFLQHSIGSVADGYLRQLATMQEVSEASLHNARLEIAELAQTKTQLLNELVSTQVKWNAANDECQSIKKELTSVESKVDSHRQTAYELLSLSGCARASLCTLQLSITSCRTSRLFETSSKGIATMWWKLQQDPRLLKTSSEEEDATWEKLAQEVDEYAESSSLLFDEMDALLERMWNSIENKVDGLTTSFARKEAEKTAAAPVEAAKDTRVRRIFLRRTE